MKKYIAPALKGIYVIGRHNIMSGSFTELRVTTQQFDKDSNTYGDATTSLTDGGTTSGSGTDFNGTINSKSSWWDEDY